MGFWGLGLKSLVSATSVVPKGGIREARAPTIRVQRITHTILGGPYYNCSIIGPKTLLKLLRPLYYLIRSMRPRSASWRTPFQHCSGTASFTLTTAVPSAPGLPSTSYTQLKGLRTVRFWGCHGLFRLGGRGASGCPVLHILKYSLHVLTEASLRPGYRVSRYTSAN